MRTVVDVYYGEGIHRIEMSRKDEIRLREMLAEQQRWTRITPLGKKSVEPLLNDFQRLDDRYCIFTPGPYVGVVALSEIQLNFNPPRWLSGLNTRHLYYMLVRANPLLPKTVDMPELPTEQMVSVNGLLEPLFNLFVSEASSAIKKGIYKTYVKEDIVSSNLKGKLDFHRQLKLDISASPHFATSRQVFTDRNSINELLYWACKVIEKLSTNAHTVALAEQMLRILPSFRKPNFGMLRNLKLERRGFHLQWAIQLAKLVVNQESLSFQGQQQELFSMVINLFDLFESYVASEMISFNTKFSHQFELPFVDGINVANNGWDNRKVFPDLVYDRGQYFVIDMKMKRIGSSGPDIADIYQLHFYAIQLGVNKAIIVHPVNSPNAQIKKFPISYNPGNCVDMFCYGLPIVGTEEEMANSTRQLYEYLMALA